MGSDRESSINDSGLSHAIRRIHFNGRLKLFKQFSYLRGDLHIKNLFGDSVALIISVFNEFGKCASVCFNCSSAVVSTTSSAIERLSVKKIEDSLNKTFLNVLCVGWLLGVTIELIISFIEVMSLAVMSLAVMSL